ncbi:prolyl 4-hydroxylase subunit alpha-1-like isoform X1 [Rhopilema esculentum]|uniref:prolyl 4-hydroxylase subunit alpha-1-like isoform X1 n=1 Tax=Rhopilema esculentum TaxID=499914 RepID=UPI0031D40A4A
MFSSTYQRISLARLIGMLVLMLTFICTLFGNTSADIYAAVAELEDLVFLEQRLLNASKNFISSERRKLANLKQFAEAVEVASKLSSGNPEEYVANPINSYLLLKRFTWGWKELGSLLNLSDEKLKDIDTILKVSKNSLPTYDEDFVGAAAGLFRLQETYAIPAREMSEGKIKGTKPSLHKLTAADCYELGELAYKNDKYVQMLEWLEEAERLRLTNATLGQERIGNLSIVLLFEHLSWAYYISGNYKKALYYTEQALKHNTSDPTMENNAKYYKSVIKMQQEGNRVTQTSYQFDYKQNVIGNKEFYNSTYARACRGVFLNNHTRPRDHRKIRCFYKRDSPRLLLKPVKVECVHDNPEVYILYDVINQKEIDFIKSLAKPKLTFAKAYDDFGKMVTANYRICKSCGSLMSPNHFVSFQQSRSTQLMYSWLFYEDTPLQLHDQLKSLDRRCADVSGLSIDSAEELQVVNYGIGGQYEFHKDHGEKGAPLDVHKDGNRIATLLFYLSDVEAGGETVFTKAGLSLKPKKGDAAFWFNLHRNNTGDWRTEHASCPVVSGSKWVMNKWFHMRGNDQRRPCTLKQLD